MSKAKNLLDFYPVVKTPKEFATRSAKRIKLISPSSSTTADEVASTPATSSASKKRYRSLRRPNWTIDLDERVEKSAESAISATEDDPQLSTPAAISGQRAAEKTPKSSAATKNQKPAASHQLRTPISTRKRKLSAEAASDVDSALQISPVKRPSPPPPLKHRLGYQARAAAENGNDSDLDLSGSLLKTPEQSEVLTPLKTTSSTIRRSLLNQLTKSVKIDELKEKLSKLSAAKASSDKEEPSSPTVTVEKYDPVLSFMLTLTESPAPKLGPATLYQRFSTLATSSAADSPSQLLTLPFKFKFLADVFHSTDTVAAIVQNRQEVCTFAKLKPAVQEMMHRNFHLKHLGQIKSVYPSAYTFKQEQILTRGSNKLYPTFEPQLTVTINTDCFSGDGLHPLKTPCTPNDAIGEPKLGQPSSTFSVDPGFLISRRRIFRKNLVQILMEHHCKFLSTLNPPIALPTNEIRRWHPSFPIEDVPEVTPSDLPELEPTQKYMSAKDVLTKVKGLYSQKLDKALEVVANKTATFVETQLPSTSAKVSTIDSGKPTPPDSNSKLKGIPLQLLAKIRAKEAEKIKAEMTRNPEADKRKVMISRLPEIVRILRNYFIAEKKAAIPLCTAVKKIGESFIGSLTPNDLDDHLKLLAELVPIWLSRVTIKGGVFLKLDRRADVNAVIAKVIQLEKAIP